MKLFIFLFFTATLCSQISVSKSDKMNLKDDTYFKVLSNVLSKLALVGFVPKHVRGDFTQDGFDQFKSLYESNKFIPNRKKYVIEPTDAFLDAQKHFNDEILISSIDLKNTVVQFDEVITSYNFIFDRKTKKIKEMRMIDPKMDYKLFLEQNNDITSLRLIAHIKRFLERFRTFYEEKNVEEIGKIYSEDAIIIEGRRTKEVTENKNVVYGLDGTKYEISRMYKKQYMDRLKNVFKDLTHKNSYLRLSFENIEIRQHGKYSKVFGVSLLQRWLTKEYTDIGDLFLIIDYSFPKTPQIRIRTWMPEGSGHKFQLYDFKLN